MQTDGHIQIDIDVDLLLLILKLNIVAQVFELTFDISYSLQ